MALRKVLKHSAIFPSLCQVAFETVPVLVLLNSGHSPSEKLERCMLPCKLKEAIYFALLQHKSFDNADIMLCGQRSNCCCWVAWDQYPCWNEQFSGLLCIPPPRHPYPSLPSLSLGGGGGIDFEMKMLQFYFFTTNFRWVGGIDLEMKMLLFYFSSLFFLCWGGGRGGGGGGEA